MKLCYTCAYYKSLAGGVKGNRACHFLLANGRSRQRSDSGCLSYIPNNKANQKMVARKMNEVSRGGAEHHMVFAG